MAADAQVADGRSVLLGDRDARAHCQKVVRQLKWTAPWFTISAATRQGTLELSRAVQDWIDAHPLEGAAPEDYVGAEKPHKTRDKETKTGTPAAASGKRNEVV